MGPQPTCAYDNTSLSLDDKVNIGLQVRVHRDSTASRWSRASFAPATKADLDAVSEATSYYYNDLAPEQGFSQAAADGLKRVPSILRNRRNSRASYLADDVARKPLEHLPPDILPTPPSTPTTASADENEQISRRLQIFLLIVLCTTNLVLAMCYSLIAPFFPSEMLRKGGTATLAGVVMSSYDFIRVFLAPLLGLYIYVIGPRFMLTTGPFVVAWCTILFGLLDKVPHSVTLFTGLAISLRTLSGIGAITYSVTSISIRPVLFAGYLSFAFGIIQASWTTGIVIGPAVGSVLYSLGGYGLPFFVIGALALTLTAVQIFSVPDLNKLEEAAARAKRQAALREAKLQQQQSTPNPVFSVTDEHGNSSKTKKYFNNNAADVELGVVAYRTPSFLGFCSNPRIFFSFVINASFAFGLTFYSANMALHIRPLLGENPDSKAGYIILIAGVTEVLIAPFAGLSLDYGVPPTLTIVFGYVCNAIGLALIGPSPILAFLSTKLWLVIVGSAIFGSGIGFAMSSPYKLATKYVLLAGFPANQQTFGLLGGCFASSYTFGCFLGPITGGALRDLIGFPWAATIVCGYLLIIMTLLIVMSMWTRLQAMIGRVPGKTIAADR